MKKDDISYEYIERETRKVLKAVDSQRMTVSEGLKKIMSYVRTLEVREMIIRREEKERDIRKRAGFGIHDK
jgi:hypothetical protein